MPSILMAPLPYNHTCTRDFWNGMGTKKHETSYLVAVDSHFEDIERLDSVT